jgi:DNA primase large subunit
MLALNSNKIVFLKHWIFFDFSPLMESIFQFIFTPEHWNNSAVFLERGFVKLTFSEFFFLFYNAVSSSDCMASIKENFNSEILLTE